MFEKIHFFILILPTGKIHVVRNLDDFILGQVLANIQIHQKPSFHWIRRVVVERHVLVVVLCGLFVPTKRSFENLVAEQIG